MTISTFSVEKKNVGALRESARHSVVSDSAAPWTVAHQAPLSVEFCRQEYWSGQPFLSPGDLPEPGIEPGSPAGSPAQILYHLSPQGRPQTDLLCFAFLL